MAKEEKPTHANSPEWAKVKIASRRESMDHFKYDELPSVLLKAEAEDGQSIADRELKRLVHADVFRSAKKTVKETNSNPRRNQ